MLYALIAALFVVVALWFFYPPFRVFVDGLKTHAIAVMLWLSGIVGVTDPTLVAKALALDPRGQAALLVGIGVLLHIARMLTKKPGKLVKQVDE